MKHFSPTRICAAFGLALLAGCAAPDQKGPAPLFPNGIPVSMNGGPIGFPQAGERREVPAAQGQRDYIVRDPIL